MAYFPQRPHVALSTAAFFAVPLREAFRHAAEAGFDGVEVMVTKDPGTQEPHLLKDAAREFGLGIVAMHAPFLLMSRKVFGVDPVEKIHRTVHLAEEVGAPLVVAHPPYRWQVGYRRWLEENLPGFAERTGVVVGVENMFPIRLPTDGGGRGGVRMHAGHPLRDLERFDRVVLDTSHAAVAGVDLLDAARRLDGRLAHVHLSNNAGRGWDSHLPIDEGVLDLDAFLAELAVRGFGGTVSLELDIRRHLGDEAATRDVLIRNRERSEAGLLAAA